MPRSSRIVSAVAALATVLLTAGCTAAQPASSATPKGSASAAAPSASAAALSCAKPGSASDAVKVTVTGSDKAPEVTFAKGTDATSTERTVVTAGTGATIKQGDQVRVAYSMFDGASGKQLDAQGYGTTNPSVFPVDATQLLPGIAQALNCTKEGERFAAVIPASQAFGTTGSEQLGVKAGDSLVFVAHVIGLQPTKADGTPKALPSGFPTVTLAANGQPTVKIPATDPPTTLRIAEREVGDGETVQKGDTVTVQYQGVLWRTGQVFDQSWTKSGPTSFATTQVVKGFGDALVGAKVGSQVVAIIPPKDGYGDNPPASTGITKTDTMVFVIDILGTQRS